MSIYLKHLIAAFNLVEKKYFCTWAFNDFPEKAQKKERKKYVQFIERVFAYELYHQYRIIIDSNPKAYKDLVLNGEVRKNGFKDSMICKNHIYPDLVLHKNQTDNTKDYQKLFIEIKSNSFTSKQLENDLNKLFVAVSDRLNFENAIFVCINQNPTNVLDDLKKLIKKKDTDKSQLSKIWFLDETGLVNLSKNKKI